MTEVQVRERACLALDNVVYELRMVFSRPAIVKLLAPDFQRRVLEIYTAVRYLGSDLRSVQPDGTREYSEVPLPLDGGRGFARDRVQQVLDIDDCSL